MSYAGDDHAALTEYRDNSIDVTAPAMGRYASQLLAGLAREFSGGQPFGRFSVIAEIGSQLEKSNGKAPADSTITRVTKTAFDELLSLGLCVPASSRTWTLSERGEIAALALRSELAESSAIQSLESDIAVLEAAPDTQPKARKPRATKAESARIEALESRIAKLEAERAAAEALAVLEAERAAAKLKAERAAAEALEADRAAAKIEAERAHAAAFLARAAKAMGCCLYSRIRTSDGRAIHSRDCRRKRESAA